MQEIGPHRCLPMSMTVEQGRQGGYSRGMADTPATVPDHAGHRSRLRARLIGGDAEGMADYELVEYLLALAIPRRDTKPLAKTRSEEHTSELQSLMRISYAVFCLKKTKQTKQLYTKIE